MRRISLNEFFSGQTFWSADDVDLRFIGISRLEGIHKKIRGMNGKLDLYGNMIVSHTLGILLIPGCTAIDVAYDDMTFGYGQRSWSTIIREHLQLPCYYPHERLARMYQCQEELIKHNLGQFALL